ncbi:MAG: thioredoxin family protein [Armatimonadota bacterium]
MRGIPASAVIVFCIVMAAAAAAQQGASPDLAAAQQGASPDLAAAQQALDRNVALGESLGGKAATPEQVATAEQLFQEALDGARTCISADSRSAEAHRLAGLVLCTAYRPVVIEKGGEPQEAGGTKPPVMALLRGASGDCEEGLAELRSALRLSKSSPDYALDYADAMLVCGDAKGAEQQATAVWDERASLSSAQSARAARLLAKCAQANNTPETEVVWLRQLLKLDPSDTAAGQRLTKLVGSQTSITWLSYESGVAIASQTAKPMLIDFTAKWCGWCKKLEQEVFSNKEMISLSQQFVCIRVDGDERPDLTRKFGVDGYPTTLILASSGHELHRMVGYMPLARYTAEVRQSLPPG